MIHVEIHILESERDLPILETAGLPRYDLETTRCEECSAQVGTVNNLEGEPVAWRTFGVVLNGETVCPICIHCLSALDNQVRKH